MANPNALVWIILGVFGALIGGVLLLLFILWISRGVLGSKKDYKDPVPEPGNPPLPTSAPATPANPEQLPGRVQDLLKNGLKIAAIKLVRDETGAGLREAKDYVEAVQSGRPATALPVRSPAVPAGAGTHPDVAALAADGKRIEAIRLYREKTGVGLKEAKDAVEGMADEIEPR